MTIPDRTSAFIEDGRYYEVPMPAESIYVAGRPAAAAPAAAPQPVVAAQAPTQPPKWPRALFVVVAALVLAAAAALTFVLLRSAGPDSGDQIAACRERVKRDLKAPATAQFSEESVSKQPTGNFYEVRGLVDAQNGFGALLRNRYTCTVTADGHALSATLSAWS